MSPRDQSRLSYYARHHAESEARYRSQALAGDPAALEFAEYHRKRREEIERELQAEADRAARSCEGESLPLFSERT